MTFDLNRNGVTPAQVASRVRVISAGVCLVLWCSCATFPNRDADDSIRPELPADAPINKGAGRWDPLYLTLRLEGREDVLFAVDTGASHTVLDSSMEPKLGKSLGNSKLKWPGWKSTGGVYEAPKLYLGNTALLTGRRIFTDDLRRNPLLCRPLRGILGMDAGKMRFLDPDHEAGKSLGQAFPLIGRVVTTENLLGVKGVMSCTTFPNWDADDSLRPPRPAETSFDKAAGRGDLVYLKLRLEPGGELLFAVDTGAQVTLLDKSLEPKLGKRFGSVINHSDYGVGEGGAYRAPRLYLGSTRLLTSDWIATGDLSRIPFPYPRVGGVLGMDCLRHYCVQMDFVASKIRFLDPDALKNEGLGNGFPLTFSSGWVFVDENLLGVNGTNSLIDAGDNSDGALGPKLFQQALEEQGLTNQVERSAHTLNRGAFFPRGVFCGEPYPDLRLWENFRENTSSVGLRFLARHLVTFNFPKRMMYLKRTSVGPLIDESSSTNAAPRTGRNGELKTATPELSRANP